MRKKKLFYVCRAENYVKNLLFVRPMDETSWEFLNKLLETMGNTCPLLVILEHPLRMQQYIPMLCANVKDFLFQLNYPWPYIWLNHSPFHIAPWTGLIDIFQHFLHLCDLSILPFWLTHLWQPSQKRYQGDWGICTIHCILKRLILRVFFFNLQYNWINSNDLVSVST